MGKVLLNPIPKAVCVYNVVSRFSVESSDESVPKTIADVVGKGEVVNVGSVILEDR
jgi:hypothetical protein